MLLFWLDTSGLALYFLDRMTELSRCSIFPPAVLARLRQNLVDNTASTNAMVAESTVIHRLFQAADLSYATLKGFSLWPVSVPKVKLRSQLDLDFLVAFSDAAEARRLLEAEGYRLHAISGRSWEFQADNSSVRSLHDMYKPVPQRRVELHLEPTDAGVDSLLARVVKRSFHSVCAPSLSPVDLFLGQGLHLYKHLCGEFSRAAHLIEFRRHILARYDDEVFWNDLRRTAQSNPRASLGLGVVTLLISHLMGDFAPASLTCWTVDRLPVPIYLWVNQYGRRIVYGGFPGSKLYLILQHEVEKTGLKPKRPRRLVLLPRSLPPVIEHGPAGESMHARMGRYYRQIHFLAFRLRFHIVEGLRYAFESARWTRTMKRQSLSATQYGDLGSES